MNDPAASLSIVMLFRNADIIVKGDLLLLLAAAVWSWAVIVDKLFRRAAPRRAVGAYEGRAEVHSPDELWRGFAEGTPPK